MKHWAAKYIGQPWSAVDNCWAFVRRVCLERYGVKMPHVEVGATDNAKAIRAATVGWMRVFLPVEGDIVLMRSLVKLHCGLIVTTSVGVHVLHSQEGVGVACQTLRDASQGMSCEYWRRR